MDIKTLNHVHWKYLTDACPGGDDDGLEENGNICLKVGATESVGFLFLHNLPFFAS